MTTYSEFIEKYIINIPAIQRDYVQGANANSTKRNEFLSVILGKLEKGEQLGLEFIYGSSKKSEQDDNNYFIPIDGQQRLTTLALLGWLLAQLAYTEEERAGLSLRPMDYSVRSSTQLFFKHLFESAFLDKLEDGQSLSDYIKTVPSWFAKNWESDPSICAMLDILDELYTRLKNLPVREIADRFFHSGVIVFDSLDMDSYGLTENLYIKMNARGKHLTDFENWKAEFYGFLKSVYGTETAERFSECIEGEWCDLFWGYAKKDWENRGDKDTAYPRIDEFFMHFYKYITDTIYISQTKMEERAQYLGVDISKVLQEDPNAKIFKVYEEQKNLDELFSVLDALVNIGQKFGTIDNWLSKILIDTFNLEDKRERINIFSATDIFRRLICGEDVAQQLRLLFYAILKRAVQYRDEDIIETKNYVRVFWGWVLSKNWRNGTDMTYAYNIRVEDYLDAREVIEELSACPDVFEALKKSSLKSLKGEQEKAAWLEQGKYDAVRILSGHPYLKGNLGNIYPALKELAAQDLVDRFVKFAEMSDYDKVCTMIPYGFRGALPENSSYRFYGAEGHWDYVFTCSHISVQKAVTSMLLQCEEKKDFTAGELEYYILKYLRILSPKGYYYVVDDFTVWELERFTGRRGYNSCPHCRMVVEQMKDSPLKLQQCAADSSHGTLWSDLVGLQMECCSDGWLIKIFDEEKWKKSSPSAKEFESFIGTVLKDSDGKDRIESATDFLRKLDITISK